MKLIHLFFDQQLESASLNEIYDEPEMLFPCHYQLFKQILVHIWDAWKKNI